jgi:hypothetical protein
MYDSVKFDLDFLLEKQCDGMVQGFFRLVFLI